MYYRILGAAKQMRYHPNADAPCTHPEGSFALVFECLIHPYRPAHSLNRRSGRPVGYSSALRHP